MASEIHVGDVGTVFEITLMDGSSVVDVSEATTKEIRLRNANRNNDPVPTEFVTDGKDGKIRYAIKAEDLDSVGDWHLQAHIVLPDGEWYSNIVEFEVHKDL